MKKTILMMMCLLMGGFSVFGQSEVGSKNGAVLLPESLQPGDYLPNVMVVKFRGEDMGRQQAVLNQYGNLVSQKLQYRSLISLSGGEAQHRPGLAGSLEKIFYVSYRGDHQAMLNLHKAFMASGVVEYAEPIYKMTSQATVNDHQRPNQYALDLIEAEAAWDIQKGSPNVVVAIVDSGVDYTHEDLNDNLYYNEADPVDGIDNDGDGFVDNYVGWDFVGADIDALFNAEDITTVWDNDPNPTNLGSNHGTHVAGIAAAVTNNEIGVASIGYNTRYMPIKCADDNGEGLYLTASGILYAANHGADIINCSFGGPGFSNLSRDIIEYATLEKNCVVIAAAGNSGNEVLQYPASYPHVLSVANTTSQDVMNSGSTFNFMVDIAAPGTGIISTVFNDNYDDFNGTSMASPMVAGVAALVRAQFPDLSAEQLAELIRVTADDISDKNGGIFVDRHGKGRVNAYRALTEQPMALRVVDYALRDNNDQVIKTEDTVQVFLKIKNFLSPGTNVTVTLDTEDRYLTPFDDSFDIAAIGNLEEMESTIPLRFSMAPSTPDDHKAFIRIGFEADGYSDYQYFEVDVNQTFLNVNTGKVSTSITSIGRIGRIVPGEAGGGVGFVYEDVDYLWEMGLLMGSTSTNLSSSIRQNGGGQFDDFAISEVVAFTEDEEAPISVAGNFDESNNDNAVGLDVQQRLLAYQGEADQDYVIIEYTVANNTGAEVSDYYVGLFSDWDVLAGSGSASENIAGYDAATRLGYIAHGTENIPYVGISLLNSELINHTAVSNADFAFTKSDQFGAISSGVANEGVGAAGSLVDASHFVGAGPFTIADGNQVVVAFAVLAGDDEADIIANAARAIEKYTVARTLAKPQASGTQICYGSTATLTATGGSAYRWYSAAEGGELLGEAAVFETDTLTLDRDYFVANVVDGVESLRTKVTVDVIPDVKVDVIGNLDACVGDTVILQAQASDGYLWNTGATSQSIEVTTPGQYYVVVNSASCTGTSDTLEVVYNAIPETPVVAATVETCKGEVVQVPIGNAVEGASYRWYGPGNYFSEADTLHIINFRTSQVGSYEVESVVNNCVSPRASFEITIPVAAPELILEGDSLYTPALADTYRWFLNGREIAGATSQGLIVSESGVYRLDISVDGCVNSTTQEFVVTGLYEPEAAAQFEVYPNPSQGQFEVVAPESQHIRAIKLIGIDGRLLVEQAVSGSGKVKVVVPQGYEGMAVLLIETESYITAKRVMLK